MKNNLGVWQFAGFTVSVALGTILHFLFEWTGAYAVAPISAVNESTWEHMKILFFPMLLFAFVQYAFFRKDFQLFWWIKLIGIVVGTVSIPILFYTYNGAFGKTPDWLNISFFFISAGVAYLLEYILFKKELKSPNARNENAWKSWNANAWIALAVLMAIGLVFVAFTFYPPKLPLFQDPLTGKHGVVVSPSI